MAKRIASVFVLLCMIFISACSEGPQLIDFINSGNGAVTLDGMTLYFKADFGTEGVVNPTGEEQYLGYALNTVFADKAIERVAEVEKKLDVNIEVSKECPGIDGIVSNIILLLAAGGGKLDASIGMGYKDFSMADISDALVPMSQVSDHIDIYDSAKWGSPERLEMFAWNGEIYGVIPNYWPEIQFASSDFILVPNIDYIQSIGMEDPRDYFENGVWTLEKLEEIIPLYSKLSANPDEIVYGYSMHDRHLYELLVQYYGADWAQKDASGSWTLGAYSQEGILAAQKLREYFVGELKDNIYNEGTKEQSELWAKGQVAISTVHTVYLTNPKGEIPASGYQYGVLPFPSQDGKSIFGQFERNVEAIMIPSFATYPEASAMVLSAIYEPFEGYESPDVLKEIYNSNIFFDERDTEIIFELANSLRVLPQAPRSSLANQNIVQSLKTKDVSTVLGEYKSVLETVLVEEFIPVKETMEELFPGYND